MNIQIESYQAKNTLLALLESGQTLTTKELQALGITRVSARIHDLRKEGFAITTTLIGHQASYHLAGETEL